MTWKIEFSDKATKQLDNLDHTVRLRILKFLLKRVAASEHPAALGKPLVGELSGHIRFRVGDYRIIGRLEHDRLVVFVIGVAHRKHVYDRG